MHKNQVGLIKLKRFSPLVVKTQQFKFMKTLTYISFFSFHWHQIRYILREKHIQPLIMAT